MSQPLTNEKNDEKSLPPPEPEWALVDKWPDIRAARLGDQGTVIGVVSHDGNGLLRLVLSVSPNEMLLLSGGFHSIQQILDDFGFQRVEVVESAGSPYGFHGVAPIDVGDAARDVAPLPEAKSPQP